MSNIDKHAVQAVADLKAGYTLGHADVAILNELARIALASLEAEASGRNPVLAYADSYRDMANQGVESIPVWSVITDLERNIAPLFTAPPAPVSVPDLTALDNLAGEMLNHAMNCERRVAVAYTHCAHRLAEEVRDLRAAMLQVSEPVTTAYKLPDSWVACSERMPEDEQEVIVHNKMGYRYVSYFDEHSGLFFDMRGGNQMNCIEHIFVTHWMPMPAAPQQEVK